MESTRGLSIADLAAEVGAELRGDGSSMLDHVAPLATARPGGLSWVGGKKYLSELSRSAATAVLISRELVPAADAPAALLVVDDADLALTRALVLLGPAPQRVSAGVHPSAVVDPTARIAETACVGPLATIGAGAVIGARTQLHSGVRIGDAAEIGADCVLWQNVVVRERCRLADRVVIHANSTIGADGYGYLFRAGKHVKIPQIGIVVIEEDVEIGANSAVDRARSGETRIRRGTKIDNLVQIAHNCEIGEDCIIVGQCGISGSTKLGRHVTLAGQVGLIDHLTIGDRVRVAAKSGVYRDLPADTVQRGDPCTEITAFARQQISLRKLPELVKQVRELAKRVEELESAADHSARR